MFLKCRLNFILITFALLLQTNITIAQIRDWPDEEHNGVIIHYTEANVGSYILPDPLKLLNGQKVTDTKTWFNKRRPELIKLFEENQFGRSPGRIEDVSFEVFDKGTPAFEGKALRKQVTIYFSKEKTAPKMEILIYTPTNSNVPVPLLLNISFMANCQTVNDSGVKVGKIWNREKQKVKADTNFSFGKINVIKFIQRGYGFATVYYGDIDPDFPGGIVHGIRGLYLKSGQSEPAADEWGAISAWAWGLSRALDYLITDPDVDGKKVVITGVSRLGKTALWTAARDERFAMAIPSCSGEGGAALSRRDYGETLSYLVSSTRYYYQFCTNYSKYGDNPDTNPVDAHMLISLIAPRPILLQTGDTDKWSDPMGEFKAAVAAEPVYELHGKKGLGTNKLPPSGVPIFHDIGYYMHHGMLTTDGTSDWDVYLKFMDMHLK
ncbi:MAG: acetylxylan esterase [Ignavibacteria bacterium]|jgi:hypothetical protein